MKLKKIFEPIRIGNVELKNRMIVSAMVTNFCGPDGLATEKFIAYHERKAHGGFSLIIPEDYAVSPTAGGFKRLPGLWDDSQIPSHRELTDRVHAAGAKIFCQIYHAGRQTSSAITGHKCVAPSAIPDPVIGETPHELTVEEIIEIEDQFVSCALRAKAACFDGVEIHGAHGYLIGQFNSPFSNKRTDQYGGTIENRARFMTEIIAKVREAVGNDFAIQFRMSAQEYVDGGLGIEDAKVIAMLAEEAGADCIHVSQGVYATSRAIIPPSSVDHGAFAGNAAAIRKVVNIPVIATGRINDPLIAEAILWSGEADICTMGRASLADPEMPKKALEGRLDEIIRCIGCLQGCAGEEGKGNCIRCLVNPLTGMEDEYVIEQAEAPKNVLVVGAGVSGSEAAIIAAQRGHKVTILEKSHEFGGQWNAAAVPVGKGDFTTFAAWQRNMIDKLGIKVEFSVEASPESITSYEPDAVILANGSNISVPPIPGLSEHGIPAEDILRGRADFGRKVAIIGGGLVGAETADHVAAHGAKDVSIIEMLPQIAKDGEKNVVYYLKKRLDETGVRVYTSAKVNAIDINSVSFEKDGEQMCIDDVDTVIIATGRRADTSLADSLKDAPFDVFSVGDALMAKNGYLGIREGYEAGLKV